MSKFQQQSMPQEQFLTVASNILYKSLIDSSRAQAKNLYKTLREGQRVGLMSVRMDDASELRYDLDLDCSEFRGKLNFGAFRASLSQLIGGIGEALRAKKELTVFSEQDGASVMFGLPGVTRENEEVNVLMLGADTRGAGAVLLKLMYVDPAQFVDAEAAEQAG